MTLKFKCNNCGYETEDPVVGYETSDLKFDGPYNWYVSVYLIVTCPRCGHQESIKGECLD